MKTRAEIVGLVRETIRRKHLAFSTEDAYCGWVARFYDYCMNLQDEVSPEDKAEAFLTHLAVKHGVAARTQNQAFAAVLFLYKEVLGRPLGDVRALRAKRPVMERVSPSREQIRTLRGAIEDTAVTPLRLLVDLIYGCGMRVSEPLEMRIKDLLWDEGSTGQILLRGAKGGKDRRVPIPRCCVGPLRGQVELAERIWRWDRTHAGDVGVALPFALNRKYPKAPFQWQWFWVFPAQHHCIDPRTGKKVRFHLLSDAIQRGGPAGRSKGRPRWTGHPARVAARLRHPFPGADRGAEAASRAFFRRNDRGIPASGGRQGEQSAGRSRRKRRVGSLRSSRSLFHLLGAAFRTDLHI